MNCFSYNGGSRIRIRSLFFATVNERQKHFRRFLLISIFLLVKFFEKFIGHNCATVFIEFYSPSYLTL